jgi:hypothetical protein
MNKTNLQKICLCASMLVILSFSCTKEKEQIIPTVYVSFSINIQTDPTFIQLQALGNSYIVRYYDINNANTLGYNNNGIIVYNNGDIFYAFDCTCPYDFPKSVAVTTDAAIAECPVCHTRYVLPSSGLPDIEGPGVYPLKEYRTSYNINTGELSVFN